MSIEVLEVEEDVYDITVPKYHNFLLDAGVVVHNSDIVGCVFFDIINYIDKHNYKSKPFLFVHDSIETDVYPFELIEIIDVYKKMLIELPMKRFNTPVKADVTLGKSLGHELELKLFEPSSDYTECTMVLEGHKDEIYDTIDSWKLVYSEVSVLEEEYEDEYISVNELFIVKKSYSPWIGKHRYKGKCAIRIKY